MRAIGLFIGGMLGFKARKLMETAEAVSATYDEALADAKARWERFKNALAGVIATRKQAEAKHTVVDKRLAEERQTLKGVKLIVEKEVRRLVSEGKSVEEAKALCTQSSDERVRKAMAAVTNISSSIRYRAGPLGSRSL